MSIDYSRAIGGFIDISIYRRPEDVKSNRFGIESFDTEAINIFGLEEIKAMVEKAKTIEQKRGTAGFNPNAVEFLYGDEGLLSLRALETIVANLEVWKIPERSVWAIDFSQDHLIT